MVPEDEWPDLIAIAQYDESVYPEDVNYYEPHDYILNMGAWLRDKRIRTRKEQVRAKQQNKSLQTLQGAGVFAY